MVRSVAGATLGPALRIFLAALELMALTYLTAKSRLGRPKSYMRSN